jgi:hypothetical protein
MLLALLWTLQFAGPVEPALVDDRAVDRVRIGRHLAQVEAELRAADVGHLPPALRAERYRNLERLRSYRLAGEFPRNSRHRGERVPYFIDDDGIACAVGHLVAESGHTDVAREIAASENNARLLTMTHPALPAWIAASGLTAEECARIQPAYCDCGPEYAPVCGVDGNSYLNACQATQCAGVAIAHEGLCAGEDTTTGWPAPGTTGDESSSGSSGGETGSSTSGELPGSTGASDESSGGDTTGSGGTGTTGTTGGEPGTSDGSGEASSGSSGGLDHEPDDGEQPKTASGCRVAGPDAASLCALLLLGLRRRVRR